jgi:hypothetical protein
VHHDREPNRSYNETTHYQMEIHNREDNPNIRQALVIIQKNVPFHSTNSYMLALYIAQLYQYGVKLAQVDDKRSTGWFL